MTQLLSALKSYIILSLGDLTHIKDTISRRYEHMTSTERAEILSMAIHNHLNKHLNGVDEAHRTSLKLSILSETLAKHNYSITRLTIFDAIIELNLEDAVKTELAESWLLESAHTSVPRRALENYMIQKKFTPVPETKTIEQSDLVGQFEDADEVQLTDKMTDYESFFDNTNSRDRQSKITIVGNKVPPSLVMTFAILFLILIIATPTYFLLSQPRDQEYMNLTSHIDANDYTGMSAVDRIYLIDSVKGYQKNNQVYFTLEKSRYNFGLMKKTDSFRFEDFNYYAVKNYISLTRNGLIGSSEQFNQIIHEAYLNDIDPLLLFAIIGQEQAFVPNNSSDSLKILNNPYNVYHSWVEYNTTLRDSTQIAINTIKNRLDKAPKSASAFQWLNATYAEDTNWHNGVRLIYAHLVSIGRESNIQ